ncbi:MAG: MMPL family transporter [Paludibacteraceae bacterium]|nr:MMPL family transporter [Paludibacteraceae bacterium]
MKLFDYLSRHKWIIWVFLILTIPTFTYLTTRCQLEENIFKLLPQTMNEDGTMATTFTHLKIKDKVFVQVVSKDSISDADRLTEAMDYFVAKVQEQDNANIIDNFFSEIDPLMLMDIATYLMEHGPAYLDLTPEQMDSLTSEEHIEQQIQLYMRLLDTDFGSNFYDIMAYDPCGLSMAKIPDVKQLLLGNDGETETEATEAEDDIQEVASSRLPVYNNHIFAGQQNACIAFLTPTFGEEDSNRCNILMHMMEKAKEDLETQYPDVEVLWHGIPVEAGYNSRQIKLDLIKTIGIALVLIMIVLLYCFKRPRYIALMIIPIAFGTLFAMATIYLCRGWMSLMALGLGAIVLGVALSYCLHVLIHYVYTGDVEETVRIQTKPVIMGTLTTIGAFCGLLFTSSSLLQDFGAFASLVIAGTTLISLVVMPHLLPKKNTPNKRAFRIMERGNSISWDRNVYVCAVTWIFVIVCITFSGKYQFDRDLKNISHHNANAVRSADTWNEYMNNGSVQQYYASVANSEEDALQQMVHIEQVVDSLHKAGVILNQVFVSDMMPSLKAQTERNAAWEAYFTPEKQDEVWQHIRRACYREGIDEEMFEPFLEAMSITAEPETFSQIEVLPTALTSSCYEETNGTYFVFFPVRTSAEQAKEAKDILSKVEGCIVIDPFYYSTDLVDIIHNDFNLIMLISSIFVFLLLLIAYRNIWLALIAFAPMMLSWYTVLGAMALAGHPFNLLNIVVSSFIFGIGVDYSIFMMDGLTKSESDKQMMVYHKTAITMSAFVLIACMLSLSFATSPALYSMSFPSLVGMITTLMLSFTLQPNLYRLYMHIQNKKHEKE